jgi:hypothetical protein
MESTLDRLLAPRHSGPIHDLLPGTPLRLRRVSGRRLRCRQGCVWITVAGHRDDVFLAAGEAWTVPGDGLVLVEAERGAAIVELDC